MTFRSEVTMLNVPFKVARAMLWSIIPGWAAMWPLDRSEDNEAELVRSIAAWTIELEREPSEQRALALVGEQLGAVCSLEPVGDALAKARSDLLNRVCAIVSGRPFLTAPAAPETPHS